MGKQQKTPPPVSNDEIIQEQEPESEPEPEEEEEVIEQERDHDEDDEYISPEEYRQLDSQLDDLNIVLDMMEQKNDHIKAEFLKLLHSNKQIREELHQENQNASSDEQMKE